VATRRLLHLERTATTPADTTTDPRRSHRTRPPTFKNTPRPIPPPMPPTPTPSSLQPSTRSSYSISPPPHQHPRHSVAKHFAKPCDHPRHLYRLRATIHYPFTPRPSKNTLAHYFNPTARVRMEPLYYFGVQT